MKTITKKLAVVGIAAVGLIGCAESNEKNVMTDPTGKVQQGGVTPAGAPRSSSDFMKQNKGAMNDPAQAAKYKEQTK